MISSYPLVTPEELHHCVPWWGEAHAAVFQCIAQYFRHQAPSVRALILHDTAMFQFLARSQGHMN